MLAVVLSASYLEAGADGKVAAPAQFSKHTVARYLRRRITWLPLRGLLSRCIFSTTILSWLPLRGLLSRCIFSTTISLGDGSVR